VLQEKEQEEEKLQKENLFSKNETKQKAKAQNKKKLISSRILQIIPSIKSQGGRNAL